MSESEAHLHEQMRSKIENNVWRTMRALTALTVLVVLLLIAGSVAHTFDLSLTGSSERGALPGDSHSSALQEPIGPGVRVQSYAAIITGAQNTAHAWAVAPDEKGSMQSATVAEANQLQAHAQTVWPIASMTALPLAVIGRSALDKAEQTNNLAAPALPVGMTPTATVRAAQDSSARAPAAALPTFLVQQPLANLRSGPGTDYPILGLTHAGNRYPIVAQAGDWWAITVAGLPGTLWIHSALGLVEGDSNAIPTAVVPPAIPTALVLTAALPTATATRLPTYAYSVEMARHAEANTLVAYALIQDSQAIVGNLYLLVTHEGQQWRSGPSSYAVSGVTKPADPGNPENKTYNAKIDFPRFLFPTLNLTGEWAITLVDGNNTPLSVTTTVQIVPDDEQREIYLHYRKVKL